MIYVILHSASLAFHYYSMQLSAIRLITVLEEYALEEDKNMAHTYASIYAKMSNDECEEKAQDNHGRSDVHDNL